jgi:hypothetical protein
VGFLVDICGSDGVALGADTVAMAEKESGFLFDASVLTAVAWLAEGGALFSVAAGGLAIVFCLMWLPLLLVALGCLILSVILATVSVSLRLFRDIADDVRQIADRQWTTTPPAHSDPPSNLLR